SSSGGAAVRDPSLAITSSASVRPAVRLADPGRGYAAAIKPTSILAILRRGRSGRLRLSHDDALSRTAPPRALGVSGKHRMVRAASLLQGMIRRSRPFRTPRLFATIVLARIGIDGFVDDRLMRFLLRPGLAGAANAGGGPSLSLVIRCGHRRLSCVSGDAARRANTVRASRSSSCRQRGTILTRPGRPKSCL